MADGRSLDGDRGSPGLYLWAVGRCTTLGRTGRLAFGNDQSGKRAWKGILASSPAHSKLPAEAGAQNRDPAELRCRLIELTKQKIEPMPSGLPPHQDMPARAISSASISLTVGTTR